MYMHASCFKFCRTPALQWQVHADVQNVQMNALQTIGLIYFLGTIMVYIHVYMLHIHTYTHTHMVVLCWSKYV